MNWSHRMHLKTFYLFHKFCQFNEILFNEFCISGWQRLERRAL